jgi:hypothetical protein
MIPPRRDHRMPGDSGDRLGALLLTRRRNLVRSRFGLRVFLIELALPFLLLFLLALQFLLPFGE